MNRQFDTASITCPCCGHVFGEQAYFQTFEVKVATWLGAKVAPPATPGYDVCQSPHFSDQTFQVKYSQAYGHPNSKLKYPPLTWAWTVKRLDPVHPNFFVLFGIDLEGRENCFLLSRNDFCSYSRVRKDGHYHLSVSAKEQSDRENYNYRPKIWKYHIPQPEINLISAIRNYQDKHTRKRGMMYEQLLPVKDVIITLRQSGKSQAEIGKLFGVSQTTIGRLLNDIIKKE